MIAEVGASWVLWYNKHRPYKEIKAEMAYPCVDNRNLVPKGRPWIALCTVWFKDTRTKQNFCTLVLIDPRSNQVMFQNPPSECPVVIPKIV